MRIYASPLWFCKALSLCWALKTVTSEKLNWKNFPCLYIKAGNNRLTAHYNTWKPFSFLPLCPSTCLYRPSKLHSILSALTLPISSPSYPHSHSAASNWSDCIIIEYKCQPMALSMLIGSLMETAMPSKMSWGSGCHSACKYISTHALSLYVSANKVFTDTAMEINKWCKTSIFFVYLSLKNAHSWSLHTVWRIIDTLLFSDLCDS